MQSHKIFNTLKATYSFSTKSITSDQSYKIFFFKCYATKIFKLGDKYKLLSKQRKERYNYNGVLKGKCVYFGSNKGKEMEETKITVI